RSRDDRRSLPRLELRSRPFRRIDLARHQLVGPAPQVRLAGTASRTRGATAGFFVDFPAHSSAIRIDRRRGSRLMTDIPQRADINLANWRAHPFSSYSFQHVSEFVPVAEISSATQPEAPSPGVGPLATMDLVDVDGTNLGALDHMRRSFTDHLVVMRDGAVIAEWLSDNANADRPHLIFSISKSL